MSNQQSKWDIIFAGFLPWVEKQPADKTYDYGSPWGCAFAQYLKAIGYTDAQVGPYEFSLNGNAFNKMPKNIDNAVLDSTGLLTHPKRDWTFGGLAQRLKEAATT